MPRIMRPRTINIEASILAETTSSASCTILTSFISDFAPNCSATPISKKAATSIAQYTMLTKRKVASIFSGPLLSGNPQLDLFGNAVANFFGQAVMDATGADLGGVHHH